jgi:hypothetical protein
VVAEPGGSIPIISKLTIGHSPEPVTSTSHPHNLSPYTPHNAILPSPSRSKCGRFQSPHQHSVNITCLREISGMKMKMTVF